MGAVAPSGTEATPAPAPAAGDTTATPAPAAAAAETSAILDQKKAEAVAAPPAPTAT